MMNWKIGLGILFVSIIALGSVLVGCNSVGSVETTTTQAATTTISLATTTTAAGGTTTTTHAATTTTVHTTTTTHPTIATTTTPATTTTTLVQSLTISGTITKNECTFESVFVAMSTGVGPGHDSIPGTTQEVFFSSGVGNYSVSTHEPSTIVLIATMPETGGGSDPLYVGGVGITTGELS